MSERKGRDYTFTAKSPLGTVRGSPAYAGALSFMRRPYSRDLRGVDVAVVGILAVIDYGDCEFDPGRPEAIAAEVRRFVRDHKACLTFDIDRLDPSYAPGTGTPVCGEITALAGATLVAEFPCLYAFDKGRQGNDG